MSFPAHDLPAELVRKMRDLDFVNWDRFYVGKGSVTVYGWIPHEDGYQDFVILIESAETTSCITSSAQHTPQISDRLDGLAARHALCTRVEYHVPSIMPNVVRLFPAICRWTFDGEYWQSECSKVKFRFAPFDRSQLCPQCGQRVSI